MAAPPVQPSAFLRLQFTAAAAVNQYAAGAPRLSAHLRQGQGGQGGIARGRRPLGCLLAVLR